MFLREMSEVSSAPDNLAELLSIAEKTAYAAGECLLRGQEELRTVTFWDAKDLKLKADMESENLIRKRLAATDLPIIGEEQGGDATLLEREQRYWVVDPLDGTSNYIRYNPATCVSIGLWQGMNPLLGVIYDFNRNELFAATVESRLKLNGWLLRPTWADTIDHSILFTGFPISRDFSTQALQDFVGRIQSFQKMRMIGSAALALTYVASGRGDVYFEESVRLWDIGAGLALIKAVGATFTLDPVAGKPLAFDVWATGRPEWLPSEKEG